MGKKKTESKPKQNQSFAQLVSKANQEALKPFIQQQIIQVYQNLMGNLNKTLEMAFYRIETLEGIVILKLGYTGDDLAAEVVRLQNKAENLESADGDEVKIGDIIRVELSTKTNEDTSKYNEMNKQRFDNIAVKPYAYDEDIETALLGMKVGESKEIPFGKTNTEKKAMVAKIRINHIARKIVANGAK